MNTHPLSFHSHGKLILFGEHSVLYGHPALGLSLGYYLNLEVIPGNFNAFPGLSQSEQELALELLKMMNNLLPISLPPAEYHLHGNIPRSSGFGSSAALCACLAQYLQVFCKKAGLSAILNTTFKQNSSELIVDNGLDPPQEEILMRHISTDSLITWQIANYLETLFHGTPSGIDTGLSLNAGLYVFLPRQNRLPEFVQINDDFPGFWIVSAAVERDGNTREQIARVRLAMSQGSPPVVSALAGLGEYSRRAINLLQNWHVGMANKTAELAELACAAQAEFIKLQLNHPVMDAILKRSLRCGALGGKLSGAGGGGTFYLICEDEHTGKRVKSELTTYCARHSIHLTVPLTLKFVHGVRT